MQKLHPECHKNIRAERQKTRYHKDPEYRKKIIRINEKSRIRRLRGETRPRNPEAIRMWRVTMLANQIEKAGVALKGRKDPTPLFPVKEGSSVKIFLSPPNPNSHDLTARDWHLSLSAELEGRPISEFPMSAERAVDLYGNKPLRLLKKLNRPR